MFCDYFRTKEKDNLSLFFTALSLWKKSLKNPSISSDEFLDAVLVNFMIINFKLCSEDLDTLFEYEILEEENLEDILKSYEEILKHKQEVIDVNEYFLNDIQIVHCLNQFQAIYFSLGILNKVSDLKLEFLSLHRILNGYFITEYLNEKSNQGSNCFRISELIQNSDSILGFKKILIEKFEKYFTELTDHLKIESSDLSDIFEKINLNKTKSIY